MIRIFKTEDGIMHEKDELQPGSWIAMTNPTASEIMDIADMYQIDPDHIKAPLDEEERSRIEVEDSYTLILVDIPSIEERSGKDWFVTIPMGIITTNEVLITVCLEETPVLTSFMDGRVRDFHTFMKTRFILQILYIKRHSVPAVPADHRQEERGDRAQAAPVPEELGADRAVGAGKVPGVFYHLPAVQRGGAGKTASDGKGEEVSRGHGPFGGRYHREQAGHRDGEYLQRHPQRHHGRLCLGYFQQLKYRD